MQEVLAHLGRNQDAQAIRAQAEHPESILISLVIAKVDGQNIAAVVQAKSI